MFPVDGCKQKWNAVKQAWRTEKKLRQNEAKSGSGASRRKRYEFYESLAFLNRNPDPIDG